MQLRVLSGHELPKTDLFSAIDPFIKVVWYGSDDADAAGVELGVTHAFQDQPNPVWDESFFFEAAEAEDGQLLGQVELQLYDEDVTGSSLVASAVLDLTQHGQDCPTDGAYFAPRELPLVFGTDKTSQKRAKAAKNARLRVQLAGLGKTYAQQLEELWDHPGLLHDDNSSTFLVPVPDADDTLHAGMCFGPRETYVLVCSTADPKEQQGGLAYEIGVRGARSTRLHRITHRKPRKMMGLQVYTELRAVNVPLGTPPGKIRIQEVTRRMVSTIDPADVLTQHQYAIGMPFLAAVKELQRRWGKGEGRQGAGCLGRCGDASHLHIGAGACM